MKKLLIATDCFLPRHDGIARFLNNIIPELTKEFSVTVVAPDFDGKDHFRCKECTVIKLPLINLQLADIKFASPSYFKIRSLVKEADIVWSQTIGTIGLCAILAAKRNHKKLVGYIHSIEWELVSKSVSKFKSITHRIMKEFAKWVYNKFTLIIVPSEEVKELFLWSGIMADKHVVKLGIDTDKFIPAKSMEKAKEKIGFDKDSLVIGFLGRIGREKDLPTLYKAFLKIEKNYKKLILLIVGDGLEDQKRILSRKANVKLVGSTDNVLPYLQSMDIYVLPSLTETSSLATMEAMSCGIPVVVTKVGSVKKYVEDKVNGMHFPKQNPLVLSLKLEMLLKDKNLREELGKEARKTIKTKFQWKITVDNVKSVLKSV